MGFPSLTPLEYQILEDEEPEPSRAGQSNEMSSYISGWMNHDSVKKKEGSSRNHQPLPAYDI